MLGAWAPMNALFVGRSRSYFPLSAVVSFVPHMAAAIGALDSVRRVYPIWPVDNDLLDFYYLNTQPVHRWWSSHRMFALHSDQVWQPTRVVMVEWSAFERHSAY